MSANPHALRYAAFVVPDLDGWSVSCSCGYLETGLATMTLAKADLDIHVALSHESDDDDA